jgi:hypothetical protein
MVMVSAAALRMKKINQSLEFEKRRPQRHLYLISGFTFIQLFGAKTSRQISSQILVPARI